MRKYSVVAMLLGLAVATATPAWADGFQSYRICGGDSFTTCAAVEITVTGTNVQMRVWNLSGNLAGTYGTASPANTVFQGIGFYNVPAGLQAVGGSLSMSGPVRAGDSPSTWTLKNSTMNVFSVDYAVSTGTGIDNSIASGCASSGSLPGAPTDLYMNPCSTAFGTGANWVTFNFQVNQTGWDPSTSDISIRGANALTGATTECWTATSPTGSPANCTTVTPEPVTMALLATGLAGMGGMGFIRRRKNRDIVS